MPKNLKTKTFSDKETNGNSGTALRTSNSTDSDTITGRNTLSLPIFNKRCRFNAHCPHGCKFVVNSRTSQLRIHRTSWEAMAMENNYGVPMGDNFRVPNAPDPPLSESNSSKSKGVRFVGDNSPASPPPTARTPSVAGTARTDDYIDLYGPRFSRVYDDSNDDREFYSKRGSSEDGDPKPPIRCFFYGMVLAAMCSLLAFLPLCSWPARETLEKLKRRYYTYGFFVGLCIFIGWAAFLVYIFRNVDESAS